MGTPAATVHGQLGISASNPVNAQFEYLSSTMGKRGTKIEHNGLRGTRSRHGGRVRDGIYSVGGTVIMQPSPEEWALLLPRILGADASGTTFALAETIPEFYLTEDKVTKVYTYDGCKVGRAVITAGENQPLQLSMDIIGKTETEGNAGTFPSLTVGNTGPFVFHDLGSSVTLLGTASRTPKSVTIIIDNFVASPFNSSQSASHVFATDRVVSVSYLMPWSSSETDLLNQAAAGAAASFTFSYGNYSMAWSFANVQFPTETPGNPGRGGEITLPLNGLSRMTGTTKEVIVTLDSTP